MAINEVAANVGIEVGTVGFIQAWLENSPVAEVIDIKFSADVEEDMICVIYRKEQIT